MTIGKILIANRGEIAMKAFTLRSQMKPFALSQWELKPI